MAGQRGDQAKAPAPRVVVRAHRGHRPTPLPGAATHSIVGLVVGATVLLWPDLSAEALLYAIATWASGVGVIEFVAAFVLPLSGARTVLVAVNGMVMAAFALVRGTTSRWRSSYDAWPVS